MPLKDNRDDQRTEDDVRLVDRLALMELTAKYAWHVDTFDLERVRDYFRTDVQIAWVYVSETDDQAWENAAHGYEYVLRGYGPGLVVSGEFKGYNLMGNIEGAHQIRAAYEASIARGEPPLLQAIFGSPETVAGALQTMLDTCRTTHLVLSMHLPGLDVRLAERSMELFMSDVKPQLSNGGPHAASEQRDR